MIFYTLKSFLLRLINKTFLRNFINVSYIISLSLILCFSFIYPFHYIANGFYLLVLGLMFLYVFLFGKFSLDIYSSIILILNISLLLSNVVNGFVNETFTLSILSLSMLPTYFYFKNSIESKKFVFSFIYLAFLVFNLFFFFMYFKSFINLDFNKRLGSLIANQNDIAFYLLIAHSIYTYSIFKRKYWVLPFLILNFIEMIATGSRSGLINIVLVTILFFYLIFRKKNKYIFFLIVLTLFGLGLFALTLDIFSDLRNRFLDLFNEIFIHSGSDNSTSFRFQLLLESAKAFLSSPVFGLGRNFSEFYTFDGNVAHNAFLEVAASYGLVSTLLFSSLFVVPLYINLKKKNLMEIIVITGVLLFFLTLSGYYYKPPYLLLPVMAVFSSPEIEQPNEHKTENSILKIDKPEL